LSKARLDVMFAGNPKTFEAVEDKDRVGVVRASLYVLSIS